MKEKEPQLISEFKHLTDQEVEQLRLEAEILLNKLNVECKKRGLN